jgi:hypothetical protein
MSRILSPILILLALLCLNFNVHAQPPVMVSATAGATGPSLYANLKAALDAVNFGTHQGNITIEIRGNTIEPATAELNASGSGACSYTSVMIRPAAGVDPVISGNNSGPVVKLNGSDFVSIDGSNNGGTSRNLTITNTSTSASNVLVIGSVGTTPINNVTVKNSILINGTNSSTAVIVGDATLPGKPISVYISIPLLLQEMEMYWWKAMISIQREQMRSGWWEFMDRE